MRSCTIPPIIGFSSISWKDSVKNVVESRGFVWNLVTKDLGEQMNMTSAPFVHGVSEFDVAGLTPVPAVMSTYRASVIAALRWNGKLIEVVQLR